MSNNTETLIVSRDVYYRYLNDMTYLRTMLNYIAMYMEVSPPGCIRKELPNIVSFFNDKAEKMTEHWDMNECYTAMLHDGSHMSNLIHEAESAGAPLPDWIKEHIHLVTGDTN